LSTLDQLCSKRCVGFFFFVGGAMENEGS